MERNALRIVLLISGLSIAQLWVALIAQERSLFGGQAKSLNAPEFSPGAYRINPMDCIWLAVSALILILLFRRVVADRRERQRLTGEVEAARVIQNMLLNRAVLRDKGLKLDAVYAPDQEVGGDFYYVLDGQTIVVGDVSGKGLKAARLVSLLIEVLRTTRDTRPSAVLAVLNGAIAGQTDGGFITCCARIGAGGEVTIADAGHLSPYVNGDEAVIDAALPLGIDPEAVYAEVRLELPPDGSMTFVSDGVVEAVNVRGELFGFDRTREISARPAQEIAAAARSWGQNDDITVVQVVYA